MLDNRPKRKEGMRSTDERDIKNSTTEEDAGPSSSAKTTHDTIQQPDVFSERSYPPPRIPLRLIKWVLGICIFITLIIVGIFIAYVLSRK